MQKNLDWYLQWIATAILIIGTAVNSLGYYPVGPLVLLAGGTIWTVAAFRLRVMSLIVTNVVMTTTSGAAMLYHYFC